MPYEDIERDLAQRARWREALTSVIPATLLEWLFGDLDEKRESHNQRRETAKRQFDDTIPKLHTTLETVQEAVEPALETGTSLPTDEHAARLKQARKRAATLAENVETDYLRETEVSELEDLRTDFQELHQTLVAKQSFETYIEPVEIQAEQLRETLAPYRAHDKYLIREVEGPVRDTLNDLDSQLDTLTTEVAVDRLPKADQTRIHGPKEWIEETRTFLDGYNKRFVEQKIHAHIDLFTDVDAAGNDLTLPQRRAIVRNAARNQVIAAAGTGKTLVLTYRIAYLVKTQDVDPSRIVALTYTNGATDEMAARLKREFDITNVEVSTLHAFGRQIANEAADRHLSTVDPSTVETIIQDIIRDETKRNDGAFARHYYAFLINDDAKRLNEADFETKAAYVAARQEQSYTTLRGEEVKSLAEKVIADFLFTHQVDYQYEPLADWADTAPVKGPYSPDFRLPEHDIYIEHWGVDAAGEVAPWFTWSTEEYREKMVWGRKQFEGRDADLVETYEFEHEAGRLARVLAGHLRHAGVNLDRMGFEEFVESVVDYNTHERTIIETFQEFITRAKQFDISPDEIPERLDRSNPRQHHFGQCGAIMLQRYTERLAANDLIDFSDMISRATEAIRADPARFRSQYDHILVDEFQDIAPGQVRLLRAFVDGDADIRLFCVGDDWQSIYAFRGAEVDSFINFADYFGPPTTTSLTENYRCPATVLEAGNALIAHNDAQLEKEVTAVTDRDTTPQLHTLDGYSEHEYIARVGQVTTDLIVEYLEQGGAPSDVMVLCRYDTGAPYTQRLKTELERREIPYDGKDDAYRPGQSYVPDADDAGVDVISIHQAKGREAKHVILLHVATGNHSFPATESVDELLAPVVDSGVDKLAEERRSFYVAVTRSKATLDVLTRADHRSPFINEIDEFLTEEMTVARVDACDFGDRINIMARVKRLWDDIHPKQHQAGLLEDRTGTRKFVSWQADEPPTVVPDHRYQFTNLRVDEYNDKARFVLDQETNVTRVPQNDSPQRA